MDLDILILLRQFNLLGLDDFAITRHLLVKLLLKATHKGIHHLVAGSLDFDLPAQLA